MKIPNFTLPRLAEVMVHVEHFAFLLYVSLLFQYTYKKFGFVKFYKVQVTWASVTTTWRGLGLRTNISNKQSRTADYGWFSIFRSWARG
jgi:hypothetical protein